MPDTKRPSDQIYVKSHVARDLLQNAALFKTDKSVIWEYVSNGLEYIDEGTNPIVKVVLESKKKRIIITDNGRGMDWAGLNNFFIMHGENIDRKQGRPGRGRFGTGKSAVFGIANKLHISTIRNGRLSEVELTRRDIESMSSENPVPVRIISREEKTSKSNGTMVTIEEIHLKSINQAGIIQYIERHLARWRNATVFINNHECEISEPPTVDVKIFKPDARMMELIGNVDLIIKIAGSPLDSESCGVSIYSNGVWHDITLAGHEGREMSQYIFGEVDVPKLDEDTSPISPFDLSRSMKLNLSNELVGAIYGFIGINIDIVRRELIKKERERKASEEAKKLARHAESIAEIINNDFQDFRMRLAKAKAKSGAGFDSGPSLDETGTAPEDLLYGTQEPAEIIPSNGDPRTQGGEQLGGTELHSLRPHVKEASEDAEKLGQLVGGTGNTYRMKGGFRVEYKPMGIDEARALYISSERTIYINTEHPQLAAAKGSGSIDDPIFQLLSFEIAFSEYCIALAHELNERNEYIDTSDPIVAIRENINRIARKAAHLFRSG